MLSIVSKPRARRHANSCQLREFNNKGIIEADSFFKGIVTRTKWNVNMGVVLGRPSTLEV